MQEITERTIKGINWNILRILFLSIFRFIVMIVLARLIEPEYFGLLSMANIFILFVEYFSSLGIGPAIIQKAELNKYHIGSAVYISIFLGIFAFIVIWFIAPYISIFFREDRLTPVIRLISTVLIINGFQPVGIGLLMKELRFKQLFIVDLAAYVFGYGTVSIVLAVYGFKVWALVIGIIANQLVALFFILFFTRLSFKPALRVKETVELLKFGGYLSLARGSSYLAGVLDSVIIGRYMPAAKLGLYDRAFQLTKLPLTNFSETISNVMFPTYSKLQDELEKIEKGFLFSVSSVTLITIPLLAFIAINSENIIFGLFGVNWVGAVVAIKILSIAAIFKSSIFLASPVTQATSNVISEAWRQIVFAIIVIVGSIYGVRFGIEGVSFAVLAASIWLYFSMAYITIKILKSTWKKFFISHLPAVFISIAIIIVNIFLNVIMDIPDFNILYIYRFIIVTFFTIATYLIFIILLPEKIKGPVPKWVIEKYDNKIPLFFKKHFLKNFK